jgi:hypothetical protein
MRELYSCAFNSYPISEFDIEKAQFEYDNRTLVLISGGRYKCDVIQTVLQRPGERDKAFSQIMKFLLAFGWANGISFQYQAELQRIFPSNGVLYDQEAIIGVPRNWYHNCMLLLVTNIDNQEQEKALSLYNDARYSGDPFIRFSYYWRILGLSNPKGENDIQGWINEVISKKVIEVSSSLQQIIDTHSNVGEYFREHCRNAIAHVERKASKPKSLFPIHPDDFEKIKIANHAIEDIVYYYLTQHLGLDATSEVGVEVKRIKYLDGREYELF